MGVYPRLVKSNAPSAKKRFGQHFLRDTGVIDRIVRWIQPASDDVFLEIGAGDGSLSSRLAPSVSRYLALEIDTECIPQLEQTLKPFPSAVILPGDFLQLDLADLFARFLAPGQTIRIAGNLPYNIATVIIEKLLHPNYPIRDMYFMVQLEVAQRITAHPSSKEYGYLTVYCQHHAEVQLGFKVSPACFVPRPKVSSSMVALRPRLRQTEPGFESKFEEVAKAAFGHRRKTLSNSLSKHPVLGKVSHSLLVRAGIDGSRRAEELTVFEFEHLASIYHNEFRNE